MILNWYYLKFTRLSLDYCYLKSKKRLAMENKIETQLHLLVENLLIKELDGKLQICEAGDVFNAFISSNFQSLRISKDGLATSATFVQVHKNIKDGRFMKIFSALPGEWSQKYLSQNQVIEFCKTSSKWLAKKGRATMFLIKKDENCLINEDNPSDNLVVVHVYVCSSETSSLNSSFGLSVYFSRLDHDSVLRGTDHHRIITPQVSLVL